MKNLFIIALALITIQVTAQEKQKEEYKAGKERMYKRSPMNPEEAAIMQTKKMTLALDLTEEQQEKIQKINLENAKQRKAKIEAHKSMKENAGFEKLTDEQKLELKNARLDKQIAHKKQMKEILTEEQYKKWSENMEKRHEKGKEKMKAYKHKKNKE
ncbi:Spy/CpxP family protein refolding chaperone [Yeosuana sp. MJ-SS3]|uniref:Spy/CpxP family protein refolding chaperone n=1 Tax=Gilvirhabdus luticola TaxID=3079858 RepID=A0ABU3U5D5_9FLAO|nr:Spy/CpxP family protein refolding chaperone [Yeosuana sp. MJ-SS3]MDU8885617.1 Spy/CpxP family protein refolding chaperone [Yeosuana sp. MJ-SS3]